jgi:hypothetical protein
MKSFVLIEDSKVANIIVAESKATAEEVTGLQAIEFNESNPAHIGLGYDGETFEQPPYVEPPVVVDVATGTE